MPCPDTDTEVFCKKSSRVRAMKSCNRELNGTCRMNRGALALLINSRSENWLPERWKARFEAICDDRPVVLLPDAGLDPAEVHYAAVWKPVPGDLKAYPN